MRAPQTLQKKNEYCIKLHYILHKGFCPLEQEKLKLLSFIFACLFL